MRDIVGKHKHLQVSGNAVVKYSVQWQLLR